MSKDDERRRKEMEQAVRALLGQHAERFGELLLKPPCRRMVADFARQATTAKKFLAREARRKTRSKGYAQLVEKLMRRFAEAPFGRFGDLTPEQFLQLQLFLGAIEVGMAGMTPEAPADPKAFVGLQEKIFVTPKKRGPKNKAFFDEAYARRQNGESVREIAHALDPDFEADPDSSMQRINKAIRRREKQAKAS